MIVERNMSGYAFTMLSIVSQIPQCNVSLLIRSSYCLAILRIAVEQVDAKSPSGHLGSLYDLGQIGLDIRETRLHKK